MGSLMAKAPATALTLSAEHDIVRVREATFRHFQWSAWGDSHWSSDVMCQLKSELLQFIVQAGLSRSQETLEQLSPLSVTENFRLPIGVIGSNWLML